MNKIRLIIWYIIFFSPNVYSQERAEDCGWEIYLGLSIDANSYYVTSINAGSEMWGASYLLTDSVLGTPNIKIDYQSEFTDVSVDWPYGYDFVRSIETSSWSFCERLNTLRYFSHGLFRIDYKIDSTYSPTSIYLDLRDDRYCFGDIWLKYDEITYKFEMYCNSHGWDSYDPLDTIKIWDYHSGSRSTTKFQPTNPTNLIITNYYSHPKLTWTASAPTVGAKYNIYRNNDLIYTTNIGETEWYDQDVQIGGGLNDPFTYKVQGLSGDGTKTSSGYSNEETVNGIRYDKRQEQTVTSDQLRRKSDIIDIFPNPFNPETIIQYTIGEQSMVKITVSDIVGKEVALLLNEEKSKGEYTIAFHGTNLSSGTYFCILRAGSHIDIKKMMIQK